MSAAEEEIRMLKQKLFKCEFERQFLRDEIERWIIQEKLIKQEKEEAEEKLRVLLEAKRCARSEFEEKKKLLTEAVDAKTECVHQIEKAIYELDADNEMPDDLELRLAIADEKHNRLVTIPLDDSDKLDELCSEIYEKRDKLLAFLKDCVKNSKITDDVKPLLRVHYDAYIDTLKGNVDDGCEVLRKYVRSVIQPWFAVVDLICPCPAAMFKILNVFLTKKTWSNGSFT